MFDGVVPAEAVCDARLVGAVAQLGERLVRNEEVSGSIPLSSTIEEMTCGNCGSTSLGLPLDNNVLAVPIMGEEAGVVQWQNVSFPS